MIWSSCSMIYSVSNVKSTRNFFQTFVAFSHYAHCFLEKVTVSKVCTSQGPGGPVTRWIPWKMKNWKKKQWPLCHVHFGKCVANQDFFSFFLMVWMTLHSIFFRWLFRNFDTVFANAMQLAPVLYIVGTLSFTLRIKTLGLNW